MESKENEEAELTNRELMVFLQLEQIFPNHRAHQIKNVVKEVVASLSSDDEECTQQCIEQLFNIAPTPTNYNSRDDKTELSPVQHAVLQQLVEYFPNHDARVLRISVCHPDNASEILEHNTLLQRCIDDLLEGRTAKEQDMKGKEKTLKPTIQPPPQQQQQLPKDEESVSAKQKSPADSELNARSKLDKIPVVVTTKLPEVPLERELFRNTVKKTKNNSRNVEISSKENKQKVNPEKTKISTQSSAVQTSDSNANDSFSSNTFNLSRDDLFSSSTLDSSDSESSDGSFSSESITEEDEMPKISIKRKFLDSFRYPLSSAILAEGSPRKRKCNTDVDIEREKKDSPSSLPPELTPAPSENQPPSRQHSAPPELTVAFTKYRSPKRKTSPNSLPVPSPSLPVPSPIKTSVKTSASESKLPNAFTAYRSPKSPKSSAEEKSQKPVERFKWNPSLDWNPHNATCQTVTIQSTHKITYNTSHSPFRDRPVTTSLKTSASAPSITVQLPLEPQGLEFSDTYKKQAYEDEDRGLASRPTYEKCEGCKAYFEYKVLQSHQTRCEAWNSSRNMNTMQVLQKGKEYDNQKFISLGEFANGAIYNVTDKHGNTKMMRFTNGKLLSCGTDVINWQNERFQDGQFYTVRNEAGAVKVMVAQNGELKPYQKMLKTPAGKSKCETISKAPDDVVDSNNNSSDNENSDGGSVGSGTKINNAGDFIIHNQQDLKTSLPAALGQVTSVAKVTSQAGAADVTPNISTAEIHNGARPKTTQNFGNNFAALKEQNKTVVLKPDREIFKEIPKAESKRLDDVHTKVNKIVQLMKDVYPEVNNADKIPEAPKDIQGTDLLADNENITDVSMEVEIQDGQEPIVIPHDEEDAYNEPLVIVLDDAPTEAEQRPGPSNTGNKRRGRLNRVNTETVVDDDPYKQLIESLREPSTSGKHNGGVGPEPKDNVVINLDEGFQPDDDNMGEAEFLLGEQQGATADPVMAVKDHVLSLFPDVEPEYLDTLCQQHIGPMAANNICSVLLEVDYPRIKAGNQAADSVKSSTTQPSIDYFRDYYSVTIPEENQWLYYNQAFQLLSEEFSWITAVDIKAVMKKVLDFYAPSHRILKCIWAQGVQEAKNKEGPGIQFRQLKFTATIPAEYLTGKEEKMSIRLLKHQRPQPKMKYDVIPEIQREKEFVKQRLKDSEMEEDYKVALAINEQEYEMEGQCIECGCCFGEYPFEQMVQCYEGHLFCQNCLKQYAKESVFGTGKADLNCMTDLCSSTFPKNGRDMLADLDLHCYPRNKGQLVKALPSDVFNRYEDRIREENLNLADLGDLVKCPHCEFRAFMDEEDKVFRCQAESCKKETCRHCQVDWIEHFGKKCSEVEKKDETKLRLEYEEKMTQRKVRVCHRCKAQFMKEDGCNKMTCRCGAKMCYICRAKDIDYNHFCRHPRDPGKLCDSCTACSLWTNPEEDDNRAVAEIQKEAEQERIKKGFTEAKIIGVPDQPTAKKVKANQAKQVNPGNPAAAL